MPVTGLLVGEAAVGETETFSGVEDIVPAGASMPVETGFGVQVAGICSAVAVESCNEGPRGFCHAPE